MSKSLESAPTHVKLAVDLIMLLEQHELPADEVLAAIAIVKQDFENKLKEQNSISNTEQ